MAQDECKEIADKKEDKKEDRLIKEERLKLIKQNDLKNEENIKLIAKWFFKQKVIKYSANIIQLADGTDVFFAPDLDSNIADALEERMIEESGMNHVSMHYTDNADRDKRVLYCCHKTVTAIGTSYAMSAQGRDNRDARVKAILKYLRRDTAI